MENEMAETPKIDMFRVRKIKKKTTKSTKNKTILPRVRQHQNEIRWVEKDENRKFRGSEKIGN